MKYYAVIVAGGSGNRMQTETPKQFLLLNNLPVLMHTINAFASSNTQPKILVVLNSNQQSYWNKLCEQYNFIVPHEVVDGGNERFHSVKNAIDKIKFDGYVAIHDAVRPLVTKELIDESFIKAAELGNVVSAVRSSDSVRQLIGENTTVMDRDEIFLVQTPQTFLLNVLREAYKQEFSKCFTDDASVVESMGAKINIICGNRDNIKITYAGDLEIATLLLKRRV